ncbi:Ferrochelatase-2, chloroplastic, partial [Linum perenne]
ASICPFDETSAVQNRTRTTEEKIGVLLLNLGGPESLNDDIIRLPRLFQFLQRPLAQLISTLRAPKSKEGYAAIGGGSPLRKITDEQAYAIKDALQAKDIKKDRITKLVVLPLYPQFSISTTGSSLRVLQSIFREDAYLSRLPVSIIQSWYQRQGYVKSMADLIEEELQTFSKPDEVMVFFSAHGVPVSYVEEAGDPYRDQMEDCIYLIMQELKARGVYNDHTLAYQSRVGPVQWLKPYTDEVLVELGKKGVKSLLAVPVSFVSEHIETLEEIDMEYRELALESGIENWGRVPALGCTTSFITDLADAVVEALPSAKAIVTSSDSAEEADDYDPFRYAIKLLFGSVVAFLLLFSPKMFVAFRKQLL